NQDAVILRVHGLQRSHPDTSLCGDHAAGVLVGMLSLMMPARIIRCHEGYGLNMMWLRVHGCTSVRRERKSSRRSIMPVRMRVLTVPRGCPSLAAISLWLKPEK